MTKVANEIGRILYSAGVRYAMGHPGGEVVELIEGLRDEGIDFVLTRHETTAAFMADAMGRYSGVPGVCVGTLGPGATNLVTGLAQAHLDRSPVIALTGQLPDSRYDIVTHQKIDFGAMVSPVTKWHARIHPRSVRAVTTRAVRVATTDRPGPVHLEVASDIAGQAAADPSDHATRDVSRAQDFASGALDRALEALRAARRPLILAGLDALADAVPGPLRDLVDAWSIPVMVSPKAKGLFPEDHPLFLGTIEMLGTDRLFEFIDESDLVVMVGMDPVEFDRDWLAGCPIIHLGQAPNVDLYYAAQTEVVGPIDEALRLLTAGREPGAAACWDLSEVTPLRTAFLGHVDPPIAGLSAQAVLRELRRILPRDALVTCDVGQNKSVAGQCWPAYEPRTFFMSNGLSTMGYGLGAAMGLQLLAPERRVACIVGDGGLGMFLGDLETVVRRELPLTIVVLADAALSQIRMNQQRRGIPATGTEFTSIDYVGLASAIGLEGREASSVTEVHRALAWAATGRSPRLVAAHIDPDCYRLV